MDIEKLREQVVDERASEPQNAVGQTNAGGGRGRSLSIDALEAMCSAVRDAAFEEGYSHGVAAVRSQTARQVRRAGEDGETAGAVAALTQAIKVIDAHWTAVQNDSDTRGIWAVGGPVDGALDVVRDRLALAANAIRENGLHGEREPQADGPGSVGW